MRLERAFAATLIAAAGLIALTGCAKDFRRGGTTKIDNSPPLQVKEDPEKAAEINLGLSRGYLESGKVEIALEKITKALEYNPKLPAAHTLAAVIYERISDLPQAELHYRRAVELQPKSGSAHNNFGAFLCHQRRYAEAETQFAAALTDPFYETPEIAMANRGQCALASGNIELAEQNLREALKRRPDQPESLYQLAVVLFGKGDFLRARAFLQRYEAVAQPSADSLVLSMQIEQKLGNEQAAREYRERLLATFPESDQAQRLAPAENTP